ncbi:hypothetical protein [Blastococcus sp. TF02A-26]|nr:hypothetical protein [Blastococcus sp. TF02A-26]
MDDPGPTHRGDGAAPVDPRRQEVQEIATVLRAEPAMSAAGIGTFD